MGRSERVMVAAFSLIALACSVISIGLVIYIKSEGHPQFCIRAILARDLTLYIYVIVLSVVALSYTCAPEKNQRILRQIYSTMLVLLGLSILVIGVVFFIILPQPYSTLEGNPKWFRSGLVEGTSWTSFTRCMKGNKFCEKQSDIDIEGLSSENDFKKNCCQAPLQCGNGTTQEPPVGAKNKNCAQWSNNNDELCYGCNICKEQVLDTFKSTTFEFILDSVFYVIILSFGWFLLE